MALSVVPVGARCLVLTEGAPSGEDSRSWDFDLVPGAPATLVLPRLPLGERAFGAAAYTQACAARETAAPAWTSNRVLATVTADAAVTVTLVLTPVVVTGSATVVVDFPAWVPGGLSETFQLDGGYPFSMAAGSDGNLWVTLATANAIARVLLDGGVTLFPTAPDSRRHPTNIVSGPDGNLWFIETGDGPSICRMTPEGVVTEFPQYFRDQPRSLAVGPGGELWFTVDTAAFLGSFSPFSGERVVYPLSVGSVPSSVAVDAEGVVWYENKARNTLGHLTPAGAVEVQIGLGSPGTIPVAAAVMHDGRVAFTDALGNRIGRVLPDGGLSYVHPRSGATFPVALAAGPEGGLWYALASGQVGVVEPDGSIQEFGLGPVVAQPMALVAGPDGAMWLLDSLGRLQRLTVP